MFPRAIAKRKICKVGRACGLGCVPKSHNCKVALRGQAKTAVEWLAHVTKNPNYEAENNAKIDKRLERFNNRVESYYNKLINKEVSETFKKIQDSPSSSNYSITYWENGKRTDLTYNQLKEKIGKDKADKYIQDGLYRKYEAEQGTKRWQKDYSASRHPYRKQNTPEDREKQIEQERQEALARLQKRNQNNGASQPTQPFSIYKRTIYRETTNPDRRIAESSNWSGDTNYVPSQRIRKARKKLSTGVATPEDAAQIKQMEQLGRSLANQEQTSGGQRLLHDNSHIWNYIASGMRLKNTIVVRSRDGVESAARITSQKNYIYVDYLASNPRNVAGGKGAISGSATAALVAVAKKAYAEGKGFHLTALSSAAPFYRKIGMSEPESHHFRVKKDDVLEFINRNTPPKSNVKTN